MLDQQEKYNIPLHLILIFVLLVIGIVTSGYVLYAIQKAEFKKRENNNLSVIADLKVREIVNWRKERLEDARAVQQNLPAIHRIRQYLKNPSSGGGRQELLSWIKSLRESGQYGSVVLLDTNKQIRLYSGDETRLVGSNTLSLADEAMRTKQIIFSDIRWGQVKHVLRIDIFVPLIIREGHKNIPVGVLLLRIDPHHTLYPIVQFWPTASLTAETLVIRREGDEVLFLNELRHKKGTALTFRMPISEKQLPAAMAARGEEGIIEGMDYRSVPVLTAIRAVPGTSWYIIAKIDSDEVYAPVHERFWMMFIVVCALIIAVGTATALAWRHQRARFYRKQYETELERKALTNHYEYLTKYANDIVLMMDADWKIVEANDRAVQAYGCTHDELLQMNIRDIRDPGALPKLDGLLEQLDERNGMVYETIHHRKDGTTFPVEISARTMMVEGKKFHQAIIRDVTERKKAEETLQISETRYRRLFESARDGILILDADTGQIIDANPFMQDLLGYSQEEFVGKKLWDIGPFKNIAASKISFDELQKKGYVRYEDLPVETSDGRRINVEFVSNVYMVESKNVIQCNIRDITERIKAEEDLKKSKILLDSVFGAIQDLILIVDKDLRVLISNWKSPVYTGDAKSPGTPHCYKAFIHRDVPCESCHALEVFATGKTVLAEYFNPLTERFSDIRAYPIFDDNNQVIMVAEHVRDITVLKEAEAERDSAVEFLRLVNESRSKVQMIRTAVNFFEQKSGCEAVGIRLKEGDDYPYYEYRGFSDEFIQSENHLCDRDSEGLVIRDSDGSPVLECMCGNVISGRFDPLKPFFTPAGSFWSNCTTKLLASTTDADRQARTRNRCNGEGYESVALIPLRSRDERFGLLQLNDRREGRFTPEKIALWERLAGYLAVALAKFEAEESLRQSEEYFRAITENASDIILVVDRKGTITYASPSVDLILGLKPEELIGQSSLNIIVPDDLQRAVHDFEKAILTEGTLVPNAFRVRRKDGSERVLEGVGKNLFRDPAVSGFVMNVRDVTERRQAEEAFRETRDLLNEVGKIARIGGWKMDLINRKATWTQGTYDIVEIAPGAPIPGPDEHVDYYLPEYRPLVVEAMRALIEDGKPLDFEAQLRTAKGNVKWCRAMGRIIREGGKAVEVYGTFQDITDRRRAEEEVRKYSAELTEKNEELRAMTEQLWQAAKLATMGELSASIAHELNNPLATVSLRTESLLIKTQQDSPMWREMKIIEQEVERMSNLVTNLLQFSRRGKQQISTVDICEEIEKSLELIYYHLRKQNVVIRREFPKEAPRIHADRQQLRQLFLNLFTNASDAMPHGGTLTIRVTAAPESKQVAIEVIDTGTGIPSEILPKVAESFYTTKPEGKGTGLGLAICKRIVQEHNGTFYLASEGIPGRGTTSHISLPVTNGTNSASLQNQ